MLRTFWEPSVPSFTLSLDIDSVGMFLAQRFVLLGVEWLAFQIHVANGTDKAGIMPSVSKGLNELVTGLNRKITSMAFGTEESNIIFLTVWLPILHMEEAVTKWLSAGGTDKAGGVPGLPQGMHHFPHNFSVAAGTGWRKELLIASFTVNALLLLNEAHISKGSLTVGTVKFFWMP